MLSTGAQEVTHEDLQPSREEQDQITRSNKKPKRKITHLIFEKRTTTDDVMVEAEQGTTHPPNQHPPGGRGTQFNCQPLSFRDMVRGSSPYQTEESPLDEPDEDEDVSDDDTAPDEILNDTRCPSIQLSKDEKKLMRKPWKNTLIIKMFDGNVG